MVKTHKMEGYIDQTEKFLRGWMSQKEEGIFKTSLTTDAHLHSFAFIVAIMLRMQKKNGKDFALPIIICTFAPVNETRSSSKCLGAMRFSLTSPASAFVPRSQKELDYDYYSHSEGKRGVAKE